MIRPQELFGCIQVNNLRPAARTGRKLRRFELGFLGF
jgi:hypothetical protein